MIVTKQQALDELVRRGRAGELRGNLIKTEVGEFERATFSVDLDIPVSDCTRYLATAETASIELIEGIPTDGAMHVRIRGIYIKMA